MGNICSCDNKLGMKIDDVCLDRNKDRDNLPIASDQKLNGPLRTSNTMNCEPSNEPPKMDIGEEIEEKALEMPELPSTPIFEYDCQRIIIIQSHVRKFFKRKKNKPVSDKLPPVQPNGGLKLYSSCCSNSIKSSEVEQTDDKIKSMIRYLKKPYKVKFPTNMKGNKDGLCILEWEDKTILRGLYQNNKLQGLVNIKYADHREFSGEFHFNRVHGYAYYMNSEGTSIEGTWEYSRVNGICLECFKDGAFFQGEYFNGSRNGIGVYKFPDGTVYEGNFANHNVNGVGILSYTDGKKYLGEFENNKFNGYGEYTWPDNRKYLGMWKEDKKEGFGVYISKDPPFVYIGFWKNNKRHGIGSIATRKSIQYGTWADGEKVTSFKNYHELMKSYPLNEKFIYREFFKASKEEALEFFS